ncbi:MAG: DUF6089 family protein [Runella sp.]
MKTKSSISIALCLFLLASTFSAHAQRRRTPFEQYSTVGVGLGTASYAGDLAPYRSPFNTLFKMMRWNINANYTRHFTPHFAARLGFMYARIAGDDEFYNRGGRPFGGNYVRNLHFRNDIKELSAVGIYKFRGDGRSAVRRASFTPYLFGGLAIFAHNPKAKVPEFYEDNNRWVALQPLGTEGQGQPGYAKPYSLVSYAIPVGLGFSWRINAQWNVNVEGGFRFTGSDFLDDVSGFFPDPSILKNDLARDMSNRTLEQISARTRRDRTETVRRIVFPNDASVDPFVSELDGWTTGDFRGNPTRKDAYIVSMITVQYVLPTKIKCPPIK